jgi:hypothetical protein
MYISSATCDTTWDKREVTWSREKSPASTGTQTPAICRYTDLAVLVLTVSFTDKELQYNLLITEKEGKGKAIPVTCRGGTHIF